MGVNKLTLSRSGQFWLFQFIGWSAWVALLIVRDLTFVPKEYMLDRASVFVVDACIGMTLSTVLRYLYRYVWDMSAPIRIAAVVLGSLAALLGGVVDQLLSALSNFILTIPQFPLLLVLASILTFNSNFMLAVLIAALSWPALMRAVRAQVLSLRERDYVEAAITLDLGLRHIILREIFPNMVSYIAINFIFAIRTAMYSLVGLIILGMVPLKEPDWGIMIWNSQNQGAFYTPDAIMMPLAPIMAIALFQLSLLARGRVPGDTAAAAEMGLVGRGSHRWPCLDPCCKQPVAASW